MANAAAIHTRPSSGLFAQPHQSQCFIHSLPDDVLSDVFSILSYNEFSDRVEFGDLWLMQGTRLQPVCSRWNQVTLSTPTLWSSVQALFAIPLHKGQTEEEQERMKRQQQMPIALDELFKRSGNTSLSITIRVEEYVDMELPRGVPAENEQYQSGTLTLMAQLWSTCDRWCSLRIQLVLRPKVAWKALLNAFQLGFPRLDSLYFYADNVELLNLISGQAPNLRSLMVDSNNSRIAKAHVLSRARDVEFTINVSKKVRTKLLAKLPNIERFNMHVAGHYSESCPEPYYLPKSCHTIVFSLDSDMDAPEVRKLMASLRAPSATKITMCSDSIDEDGNRFENPVEGLKVFILESGCIVTHFVVQELPVTWDELAIPLEAMSGTLTHFGFSVSQRTALTFSPPNCLNEISMPRLEDVEICLPYKESVDDDAIVALATWWADQPAMKSFRFQVSVHGRRLSPAAFDKLKSLVQGRQFKAEIMACTRMSWRTTYRRFFCG